MPPKTLPSTTSHGSGTQVEVVHPDLQFGNPWIRGTTTIGTMAESNMPAVIYCSNIKYRASNMTNLFLIYPFFKILTDINEWNHHWGFLFSLFTSVLNELIMQCYLKSDSIRAYLILLTKSWCSQIKTKKRITTLKSTFNPT